MSRPITDRIVRAFTLIEVMMATVILGLGILGLLALFAGTARQQQEATDATRSLQVTRNAQALIGPNVGRLTDVDNNPLTGALSNLMPDIWYPMTSVGTNMDTTELVPRASTGSVGGLFFLADTNAYVPYEIYSGSEMNYAQGVPGAFCSGAGSGQFSGARMNFIDRRLEPCSVSTIIVTIVEYDMATGETSNPTDLVYTLGFVGSGDTYGNDAYYFGDEHSPPPLLGFGGPCNQQLFPLPMCGDPTHDFIRIDLQETPENGTARANIADVNVAALLNPALYPPGITNPRIERIVIPAPFQHRRSRLVSLTDRIVYTTNSKGERVADLGYSLLFRRSAVGLTEVMAATYKIRQTQSGSTFEPQEDFTSVFAGSLSGGDTSLGPLRRVQVTLGFDDDDESRQQYFIEVDMQSDRWIVEPGTVLLVQGDATGGPTQGSELSVTVESVVNFGNGVFRGYLDRAPRNRRRILLDNINEERDVEVWAVQPRVQARDGSTWALEGISIEPVLLFEDN